MTLKKYYPLLTLIFILLIAAVLRLYQLGEWPEAFAADEAALAYNAWSLATTGKDEWGARLPLMMRSFDDNKPAIYSYLDIPFVMLFGLSETTARTPSAIFGIILVGFLFAAVLKLTRNLPLAAMSGLIAATSPWHIEVSRTAIEAGVALSITVIAIYFFSRNDKKSDKLGLILLLLSLFTYHTARLISPTIILAAVFTGFFKKQKYISITLIGLLMLGVGLSLTQSSWRFKQISFFSDQGAKLIREEAIREDGVFGTGVFLSRLFHNKPLSWIRSFTDSYLKNTSLHFLFMGGAQPPRVTIPEVGQFHLLLLPFFVLGLAYNLYRWKPFNQWLIIWLILAPIPASLTTAELPHTYRTLFMLPVICIIIAQGIVFAADWFNRKFALLYKPAIILFFIFFAYNTAKDQHQYLVHQQLHQPWYRQYGYEKLIHYLNGLDNIEHITMTNREGEPYIFILFYNQIPPNEFHQWPAKRLAHKDIDAGVSSWEMFNYTFTEEACPYNASDTNPNHLYVVHFTCQDLPPNFERIQTIEFMDGAPEFYVDRPQAPQQLEN